MVAFAQPAPNRVVVFAARHPEVIYALNPAATGSYRNALTVSHARNDQSDARDQAHFVAHAWAQWWDARRAVIKNLVPLGAINPADELEVSIILHQLEVLNAGIKAHDSALAQFVKSAGEKAERIAALSGAGPIYTPRIHAAMEKHAPNCESPEAVAAALGIAPITDQSGKMGKVQRQRRGDIFTQPSFVAWAKASWQHSIWAEAFYRQREAKGHGFNTIMRALAYKWIRIRWRCGQDDVAYDEMNYLKSLRAKGTPLGPEGLEL